MGIIDRRVSVSQAGKKRVEFSQTLPLLFPPRCRHRKDRSLLLFLHRFGNVWIFPNVFSSLVRRKFFLFIYCELRKNRFCLTIDQTIGRRAIANTKINLSSFCSPMIMIIIKSQQILFPLIIPGQRCRRRRVRLLLRPLRLLPDPVRDQAERGPQLKRKTRAKKKQLGGQKRISLIPHPTLLRTYKGFSPLQSLKRSNFKGLRFETLEGPISIPTPPTNQCPSKAFEKFRCCPFTANRTTLKKHAWNSACKKPQSFENPHAPRTIRPCTHLYMYVRHRRKHKPSGKNFRAKRQIPHGSV